MSGTLGLDQRFNEALATATNLSEPDSARSRAIELLALQSDTAQAIIPLAIDDPSQAVRLKAVEELSKQTEVEPWQTLLAGFFNEFPIMRRAILDNILLRSDRTNWLLDEIAAGKIMASEIGRNHIDQLLNHPDVEIKTRAEQLLGDASVRFSKADTLLKNQTICVTRRIRRLIDGNVLGYKSNVIDQIAHDFTRLSR